MTMAIVGQIQFNVQKMSKANKPYNVTVLKYTTEAGMVKTENCFDSVPYASVLKTLSAGDEIDVTLVKNGEFYNLSDLKLVKKSTGEASVIGATPAKYTPKYTEDSDRQSSIQRQNALTNATNLVSAMVANELFKKTTKQSILVDEIIKIATQFEGYTSGRDKIEKLTSTIPDAVGGADAPFDTEDMPY